MTLQVSPVDKVLRTILVYLVMLALLRMLGRRTMAQMNNFDLVGVLLLSNVVQNAIIGPDNSLLGGVIGAVVLMVFSNVIDIACQRWAWLGRAFQSSPLTLVVDGHLVDRHARTLGLSVLDIDTALRTQGATSIDQVETGTLTPEGALIVNLKPEFQTVTRSELHAALAQLKSELVTELRN